MFHLFAICCLAMCVGHASFQWENIPNERDWIEKNYLPFCSGRTLYIGVGSYTIHYPYLTQNPSLFETIDCLEERAQFGSPFKHHVGDILQFQPEHLYDNVSFFGVLGYHDQKYAPFNTDESIHQALEKIHRLVKVGGTLQIGPNYYDKGIYTSDFWMQKLKDEFDEKYEILSMGISPLSVIWLGRKLRN